jgi:hypothetical protein
MPSLKRFVLFLLLVVCVSCGAGPTEPGGVDSPNSLCAALQREGVTVTRPEQMPRSSFPFFSVNSERLLVNGESVHAFDYTNETTAEGEARLVSADGSSIGTTSVSWVSTPHFYKRSSTVAPYVGQSSEITRAFTNVLGPQFAGGD